MSPERWQQVEEIFQTVLDLSPGERTRFVLETCAGDMELRREVEALLTQYEAASDFLNEPLLAQSGLAEMAALMEDEGDPFLGERLGAYRILKEIGRGGMGAVYLAERADNAFQRQVAIKVIKRGMDTDFILRRFRHERQILAALDHPHITRLLDGGATPDGLPYFVMEHIEGEPLYQYCDRRRLGIKERLRLFTQVCAAVEYAHRQQVIHRDIKPANILVTAGGVAKLFDFGIAKLLNPELTTDTAPQTATAMRLMTVEYASPEQVQGLPVTFLSDVYSLGVLLYELLTGHRPYKFKSRLLHEMARVIMEEEPELPSLAVTQTEALLRRAPQEVAELTVQRLCEMRGETPEGLRRVLAGSLDNIALKALRKEAAERYQSARELQEDIERYLAGQAVAAPAYYPPAPGASPSVASAPEAGRTIAVLPLKFLNPKPGGDTDDNYLSVGFADAIITRLSNVRRLAVRPTSSVLRYGGAEVDPLAAGRALGVGFVLDGRIMRAGKRIRISFQLLDVRSGASVWAQQFDEEFTDVLSIEDAITAQVTAALVPHLSGEEQRQVKKRGTDNPEAFEAYLRGRYYWNTFTEEGFAKALVCYHRAVAVAPDYALAYAGIADYYNWLGVYAVLPFAETSAAAKEAALKAVALDDTLAEGYAALGFATLMRDFNWEAAERYLTRALELNPHYVTGRLWYCYFLGMAGRFDEALAQSRRALELDPLTPIVHHSLSWTHYHARHYEESVAVARRLVAAEPQYGLAHVLLSLTLWQTGRYAEAIAAGQRAIELLGRSPYTLAWLASAYAAAGQRAEALALLAEIQEMAAWRYVSPYLLAVVRSNLGEEEQAWAELERALEIRDARLVWLGVDPQFDSLRSDSRFHALLRQTNNPAAARHAAHQTDAREKSIAVLPFKLLGADSTDSAGYEYLGIGLADALITRLSNVRRISVRPTSSVARFAQEDYDPLAAGRALGVSHVLDGRMQLASDRVRVTMQLISVNDRIPVWARQFNERFTDALGLQDSLSQHVAEVLVPQLTGDERKRLAKRGTDDAEAFEAFLRGRYYWYSMTTEGFAKALTCYQRAVALDPAYAAAYAGIAEYHCWVAVYGLVPPAESLAAARVAAARAVELDDTLAEAHTAYALSLLAHEAQWQAAGEGFRRAIELNPKYALARAHYACHLAMEGCFAESLAEARQACELDPLNPFQHYFLSWCLFQARRYDECVESARLLLQSDPHYGAAYFILSWALRLTGEHKEAIGAAQKAIELVGALPMLTSALASAYAAAGQTEDARRLLAEMSAQAGACYVTPYHRALVHLQLGEPDAALALLAESLATSEPWIVWLGVEPQFDPVRSDPRFGRLLARAGNPHTQDGGQRR